MKQHALDGRHMRRGEHEDHGNPALDGLRALSICLVLAAHLLPLGPKALHLNSTAGPMGMSLFFALSGNLMVSTLRSATIPGCIVRRLSRIAPLASLCMLLVCVLFSLRQ